MKYSELEENWIFEAIRLFGKLKIKNSGKINVPLLEDSVIILPDSELITNQICKNVMNTKYSEQYITDLNKKFKNAFELIEYFREEKYALTVPLKNVEKKYGKLTLDKLNWIDSYKMKVNDSYDSVERSMLAMKDGFDTGVYWGIVKKHFLLAMKDGVNTGVYWGIVRKLYYRKKNYWKNVNNLLLLAETIQETIKDVEQALKQQLPTAEAVEEKEESDAELEKTAHKVVLLHELDVIAHLHKLCKEKNPTMSDTKFAELIGLILGLQGKKIEAVRKGISGYGQGTKDDPKTQKALQKVRSELLKFGIEL